MSATAVLLLATRTLIAAVLATAGIGKLAGAGASRAAVDAVGVPPGVAAVAAALLAPVELAVAVALLLPSSARAGAAAALALALVFVVVIGRALMRGGHPDCHCFGALHSRPVDRLALAHALALGAGALAVLLGGAGHVPVGGDTTLPASLASNLVLCVVVRAHRRALREIDLLTHAQDAARALGGQVAGGRSHQGRPIGSPAPPFVATTAAGEERRLDDLVREGPAVLVFTDSACPPCRALFPWLSRWQRRHAPDMTIAVIAGGDPAPLLALAAEHGVTTVLVPRDDLRVSYAVHSTPAAVLLATDGTIGSGVVAGADAIAALLEDAAARAPGTARRRRARLAEPRGAPPGALGVASDGTAALGSLAGRPAVVMSFTRDCFRCDELLTPILRWEAHVGSNALQLIVLAADRDVEPDLSALRSRMIPDPDFAIATEIGLPGTPSAILVGADGRPAATAAVGAAAVLAMLGALRR
jgi:uncharacterized membrane protein YphA (DoxX/SURF4 family)